MNRNIKELAQNVEVWLAKLRYANGILDQKISLKDIVTLSEISTGNKIYSNPVERIKIIVDYYHILVIYSIQQHIHHLLMITLSSYYEY